MCHSAAISWQLLDTTCEEDLVFPFLHHPCMTGRSQQRALWPYLQSPCCEPEKFSSVQSLSRVRLCDPMNRSTPGLPVHYHLPEFTQIHVHRVSDAIQPSHPLLSPSPPALNLSQHQVFSNKSALRIRWPKYWSFSFNISPSNEHPGLISFRTDWLDLLAVQGSLKSLLQHHSSRASHLGCYIIMSRVSCNIQ